WTCSSSLKVKQAIASASAVGSVPISGHGEPDDRGCGRCLPHLSRTLTAAHAEAGPWGEAPVLFDPQRRRGHGSVAKSAQGEAADEDVGVPVAADGDETVVGVELRRTVAVF